MLVAHSCEFKIGAFAERLSRNGVEVSVLKAAPRRRWNELGKIDIGEWIEELTPYHPKVSAALSVDQASRNLDRKTLPISEQDVLKGRRRVAEKRHQPRAVGRDIYRQGRPLRAVE
jgi:hypothetical protein